ncbi:amidohydrolase family protein [Alphaproteobacteria bacterium]|nr:amidohydrolase family protein [Alphaproteobacteria bacterium]
MLDILIKSAEIVDGTGSSSFFGDVGIKDGLIAEVGKVSSASKEKINADGLLLTPGWVDIHTHYDGQATWDPLLTPSFWQGVTTTVMGNCGVGFAPVKPTDRKWLIGLMEGVEDIPGSALSIGLDWQWETFPEYLNALEKKPHAIDLGCQIAHGPLRAYVMGERGAKNEVATPDDIEKMSNIVEEALNSGALGFSTSRTLLHLAIDGEPVPGTYASESELMSLAKAVSRAGHGIFELAPAGISGDDLIAPKKEMQWMEKVALETGVPLTFLFAQNNKSPESWKTMLSECEAANARGAKIFPQVFGRPTTLLFSFQGPNPFARFPTYLNLLKLSNQDRIKQLKRDDIKNQLLSEVDPIEDAFADMVQGAWDQMYVMDNKFDFEPPKSKTIKEIAKSLRKNPKEVAYDEMIKNNGKNYIMFCGLNYTYGNLDALYEQLNHPLSVLGGGDGGAHVSYICDSNVPTFMMTHWARDRTRGPKIPIEKVVKKQTYDTAKVYGLNDRGLVSKGFRADINLINLDSLNANKPIMVNDLPGGAQRLMATANGYEKTFVFGKVVQQNGEETGERPGRLIRGPINL